MTRLSFVVAALSLASTVPGTFAQWHHGNGGHRKALSCLRSQQWLSAQACVDACTGEQKNQWWTRLIGAACERVASGETPSISFSQSATASATVSTLIPSAPESIIVSVSSSEPVPSSTVLPTTSISEGPSGTNGAVVTEPTSSQVVSSEGPSSSTPIATPTTVIPSSSAAPTTSSAVVTTSAAPVPTTSVAAPAAPATSSAPSGGASDADRQLYLDTHNGIRARHGASALTWSTDLEAAAQKWANNCKFTHSGGAVGPYGENLSAGTGSGFGISQAVQLWINEEPDYNPANPQYSHFTQMVWKGTTQLGCAVAQCDGIFDAKYGKAKFFVCEYNPAGNVIGQFPQNVQA